MKSWRERIIEAEARGHFNGDDWDAWSNLRTCPAAEIVVDGYGIPMLGNCVTPRGWHEVWRMGSDMFSEAMTIRNFPAAHAALDAMADKALEIKRGLSSNA